MLASRLTRYLRAPQRAWQFHSGRINHLGRRGSRWIGSARASHAWQSAVVGLGRRLDRVRRDNFLVLSSARAGTTLLIDYLNCHRQARCRGEILNADYGFYGDPTRMNAERLRLHVESHFVKRPGTRAGAKILTYQLDELPITLAELLDLLHGPRVIVLYRPDTLNQFASLKLAEQTGIWHVNRPTEPGQIRLDADEFVAYAQREHRMWQENLDQLVDTPLHYLTYDELTRGKHTMPSAVRAAPRHTPAMDRVFAFLGLAPCPVQSPLVKLNRRPLAERVANYQELAARGLAEQWRLELSLGSAADRQAGRSVPSPAGAT